MIPELKREMTVEEFEALPEDLRPGWEPIDGAYVAVAALQSVFDEQEAELATFLSGIENKAKETDTMKGQLGDAHIQNRIQHAMSAAGCPAGLLRAAEALFRKDHSIDFEYRSAGDFDALVAGPDGQITIEDAVANWLETDDGGAFLSRPRRDLH